MDRQYAVDVSEATPRPIERIGQGDRSQVVAWDEIAAAGPAATYQVFITQRVRQRLPGAPPLLTGSVAGLIAVLRVDPTEASMSFRRRRLGDAGWTVTFGAAQGSLTYWVLQPSGSWCCST
jgi:hypothetical protein